MKPVLAALAALLIVILSPAARAQEDIVWVQIEAQPSLRDAETAARRYSAQLPDVNGFALGSGWYAIVLGPYTRADAEQVLRVYRSEGRIARDSYVQISGRLGQQFWPVGADLLERGAVSAPVAATDPAPQQAETPVATADETPAEARQSEARLTADERRALQIALQWAGFYTAAIDGAFGPGTRRSMTDWQIANGHDATGILTTAQRSELLAQYNAPLTSVGMAMVTDDEAGIEMLMPMGEVAFEAHQAPFARYTSAGDPGVQVFLISQPGDQTTLFGLYEIMQTLDIVPLDGPRERRADSFSLTGRNDRIVSHTEASLRNGEIKGFTLIWPAGDEARRTRILDEMRASFTRLPGVLDPAAGTDQAQNVDLISGLQIRRPRLSRSGFYVDNRGTVITTAEVALGCARITLEQDVGAQVVATDDAIGIAVLRPGEPMAPATVARLSSDVPRLQSDVAVSGFPYEGLLNAPTLTFGTLADVTGLRGETELQRLSLDALPGDAGGPVLDTGGGVLGMLLPRDDRGAQLPRDVSFAVNARAIGDVLSAAGLNVQSGAGNGQVTPAELNRIAAGMTVLVSCWD